MHRFVDAAILTAMIFIAVLLFGGLLATNHPVVWDEDSYSCDDPETILPKEY